MTEFNVGDRVRVTRYGGTDLHEDPPVGTISRPVRIGMYISVRLDTRHALLATTRLLCHATEIEPLITGTTSHTTWSPE